MYAIRSYYATAAEAAQVISGWGFTLDPRITSYNVCYTKLLREGSDAFCAGGDQRVRGSGGYVGGDGVPRLNILDVQRQIRTLPKPVVAMVAGYAIGGGHVLHMLCDLTIVV